MRAILLYKRWANAKIDVVAQTKDAKEIAEWKRLVWFGGHAPRHLRYSLILY